MDRIRIKALGQAVERHLAEHGARNWKLVQSRFPDVPHATFWRTVKAVRTGDVKTSAQSCLKEGVIYFFPPTCEPMKKLIEFQDQVCHADQLIAQSKGLNGSIKNWQMHAKGVWLRQVALDQQLDAQKQLMGLNKLAFIFTLFMQAIEPEAPAVRLRIIDMLEQLLALEPQAYDQLLQKVVLDKENFQDWPWKTASIAHAGQTPDEADSAMAQVSS